MNLLELPNAGRYGVVYADPAWRFRTRSAKGVGRKSPEFHYPTATLDDMAALPVREVVGPDCLLFMWVTWPFMLAEHDGDVAPRALARAWGFDSYSTGGAWAKQTRTGRAWQFGTGYRFRSASEPLVLFQRGSPAWFSKSERNLWVAPVREHSRKPDCVRAMIERAAGPSVPKLELFSRTTAQGWDVWGNQVGKFEEAVR